MAERFIPCPECGFAVEAGREFCPDCGLHLRHKASLFGRLMGRGAPQRNPENLRALEARLQAEVERLQEHATHLEATRRPLQERVDGARSQGRDPGPLLEAIRGIDAAIQEARLLVQRQRAVLAGVDVERSHNRIRAFMAGLEDDADGQSLDQLLSGEPERAALPLPAGLERLSGLAWSPCGRWLAGLTGEGRQLLLWSLEQPGPPRSIEIPHARADLLAFSHDSELLALGCRGGVQLLATAEAEHTAAALLPGGGWGVAPTVTALAIEPGGAWLAVGDNKGQLHRFACDDGLRALQSQRGAHGFGLAGLAVEPGGLRMFSAGSGTVRSWWVQGDKLVGFSSRELAGAGHIGFDPGARRIAVAQGGFVSVWDASMSHQLGRFGLEGHLRSFAFFGDGQRLACWSSRGLVLGSPASRKIFTLWNTGAELTAVAFAPHALRAACATEDPDGALSLELVDFASAGLVGLTRKAMAELENSIREAIRLRSAFELERPGARAAKESALVTHLRGLVRDAGLSAVYAVTRRAQAAEEATRRGGELDEVVRQLDLLFGELDDLEDQLERARVQAPDLEPYLQRLRVLPVAVLRGQVDALMHNIEVTIRSGDVADEESLRVALARLRRLEAHVGDLERLANGLSGHFWGNPERPLLVEALRRLQRDFPGWIDAMLARIVSSAIGRIDALEESFGLDVLRDQRARIAGQAGAGGDVAAEADWVLRNAMGEGVLGKDHTEAERQGAVEQLDAEWRRLDAETRAWLEMHRVTQGKE